jgi:hypothetical protein
LGTVKRDCKEIRDINIKPDAVVLSIWFLSLSGDLEIFKLKVIFWIDVLDFGAIL